MFLNLERLKCNWLCTLGLIDILVFSCNVYALEELDGSLEQKEEPKVRPAQEACNELEQNLQQYLEPHKLIEPVYPGDLPFMAALMYERTDSKAKSPELLCGGTLIHDRFTLAAAYCVNRIQPTFVRLGMRNFDDFNEYANRMNMPTWKIHDHPEASPGNRTKNVSLKKKKQFEKPVPRLGYIKPICLQTTDILPQNATLYTPFWGPTSYRNPRQSYPSNTLYKTTLKISPDVNCNEIDVYNRSDFICASEDDENKDAFCIDDSAGPLILEKKSLKSYQQISINAFASKCSGGTSDIYKKLSRNLDFIESVVWPEKFEKTIS